MAIVAVTGASGFLGRAVVATLLDRGFEVVAISRSAGWHHPDSRVRSGDFRALRRLAGATCIHLSAPNALEDNESALNRAREEAGRLNDAVLSAGLARIVFASSAAVYGDGRRIRHSEDSAPQPRCAYARLKLGQEGRFLPGQVVARLSNLYGPGMSAINVFSHIVTQLLQGDRVLVRNLNSVRDYLFVDDAARALVELACSDQRGLFNVSSGQGTRVDALIVLIAKLMGRASCSAEAVQDSQPASTLVLDPNKLRRAVGWQPTVTFEEGMRLLLEHYR